MSQVSEAINIFKKRRKFYQSTDVKIAAIKVENSWYNIRTRVLLSCNESTGLTQREIDVDDFILLSKNISANDFPALIETLDQDEVEVDGVKIIFFAGKDHQLTYDPKDRKSSEFSKERWNSDWPLDVFRWRTEHKFSNQLTRVLNGVTLKLNCYNPPYEDVHKAVREFLELDEYEFQQYQTRNSLCYILLPDYLAIEKCILKGNQLDLEVKSHRSTALKDIRLNLITRGKVTQKHQVTFDRKSVKSWGPFKSVKERMTMKDTTDVQAYVFLKDRKSEGPSDKCYVRNVKASTNLLFGVHETFDTDASTLTRWLHGLGRNRADDFEQAVTVLLYTCGFFTEWLGRNNLAKDAPDIIAFSPDTRTVVVGECKTDVFGWKEIRKLIDRAERICREHRVDTYPVVFTCISSYDVGEEMREKARNQSVRVLAIEEIEELEKTALRGSQARDVLRKYFQYVRPYSHQ